MKNNLPALNKPLKIKKPIISVKQAIKMNISGLLSVSKTEQIIQDNFNFLYSKFNKLLISQYEKELVYNKNAKKPRLYKIVIQQPKQPA